MTDRHRAEFGNGARAGVGFAGAGVGFEELQVPCKVLLSPSSRISAIADAFCGRTSRLSR